MKWVCPKCAGVEVAQSAETHVDANKPQMNCSVCWCQLNRGTMQQIDDAKWESLKRPQPQKDSESHALIAAAIPATIAPTVQADTPTAQEAPSANKRGRKADSGVSVGVSETSN